MKYNPAIHNRKSIRLKGYDYSKDGLYFITICTQNRECLFGNIIHHKMILNDAGNIAHECWLGIPEHFPNVDLHEYVVMPNHVHGIVELTENAGVQNFEPLRNRPSPFVGAQNFVPLRKHNREPKQNAFQKIIPRSIGSIVRGYKIGVTKWFRNQPAQNIVSQQIWQRNFHDHIIRDEESYHRIANYIINNPANWKEDKFFSE